MKALQHVLSRFGYIPAGEAEYASWTATKAVQSSELVAGRTLSTTDADFAKLFNTNSTYAGRTVNADTAMQQGTVFTCVRIISETVGTLPAGAEQEDRAGNVTPVHDYDLSGLLFDSPNSDMDGVEYIEAKAANLALQGNGYSLLSKRTSGGITSVYPIASDHMEVTRNRDTGAPVYRMNDRGKWTVVPRELIWHVKGFGTNGLIGFSPIGFQRNMIGMALATEEFQSRFFSNGAAPSWLVTIPQWLNKEQRDIARENLNNLWGGLQNAYRAQLLEGGMSAVAATMPLQDAQFLELKGSTKKDIFGMYRVPPHMGGDLEQSTNNNIEQQAQEFVTYCILPYLRRLEKSASKWLIPAADRVKGIRLRFNLDGLLRADAAARGELYSKLLINGVLNRNEVRGLEGRNRVNQPSMDTYTVQSAMVPIEKIAAIADKAATVGTAPPPALPAPGKELRQQITVVLPDKVIHDIDIEG